jgi:hypothetical protein
METPRNLYFFLPLAGFAACLFFAAAVTAMGGDQETRQPAWVEPDVDRPGSDFKILWLHGGLEACQEACAQNSLCKSYTYVRPGVAGQIEGCWLKNAVNPPVTNGCCVSGVKTDETVSRFLREPVVLPGLTKSPPTRPMEQAGKVPVIREEKVPETGSGKRRFAGLNFAATPPAGDPGEDRNGIPAAISPPAGYVGAGRREKKGIDFAAVPPGTAVMRTSEPVPAESQEIEETGTGRRIIRGVAYAAAPSSGRKSLSEGRRTGSVKRNVTGVDITAIPSVVRNVTGVDITAIPPQR